MRNQELAAKYPNLFVSQDGQAVYVCREGRDAENMCFHAPTPEEFKALNVEATMAVQEGWFYCTGCHKAKPRSEYAFFYFAGSFCNDCKAADPSLYRRAMSESYE